jgi:pimeloyl-ACP methyl ester carboxylesterase
VLSVPRQRADYSTVIGWAVEQPYIDPRQIIIWGTSFAGMHVLELAVSDTRLTAVVAQAPLTDGLAATMMSPLKNGARLFGFAVLDRLGSLFGRQPIYIPGHGKPGEFSIGATPDGPFGEKLMTPKDGTPWHDRVAARSLLSFSWRRPVRRAASVRVPFLLVVPEADAIAPVPAALEVARKAPGAELFRSSGGHYDLRLERTLFKNSIIARMKGVLGQTRLSESGSHGVFNETDPTNVAVDRQVVDLFNQFNPASAITCFIKRKYCPVFIEILRHIFCVDSDHTIEDGSL